jgi:hypothetical protein
MRIQNRIKIIKKYSVRICFLIFEGKPANYTKATERCPMIDPFHISLHVTFSHTSSLPVISLHSPSHPVRKNDNPGNRGWRRWERNTSATRMLKAIKSVTVPSLRGLTVESYPYMKQIT